MVSPRKLHHIALAVKDAEAALAFYQKHFGAQVIKRQNLEEEKTLSIMMEVGDIQLELLQSTDPEGPVAKLIERRGEGVHSISFVVDDLEQAVKHLEAGGLRMVGKTPRYAFIHPKDAYGVMFELHIPD